MSSERLKREFSLRHLLGMEGVRREDIVTILDLADAMAEVSERPIKKVPTLRGKTVITLFAEASTRTRASFEIAGKRLSAEVINLTASTSSFTKGETLLDTAKNLEAMRPDILVVRHGCSGAPHFLAQRIDAAVLNAGDGWHEHPSQALLDAATIRKHKKSFEGLRVAICGDITHSRVARSNIHCLKTLGAQVTLAGPRTMMPTAIERLGVEVHDRIEPAIEGADVIMMLRIQLERQAGGLFPNGREHSRFFGLNRRRAALAKPDAIIMHPGPINRGLEIEPEVADGDRSVILQQVTYRVAVRMALLCLFAGQSPRSAIAESQA